MKIIRKKLILEKEFLRDKKEVLRDPEFMLVPFNSNAFNYAYKISCIKCPLHSGCLASYKCMEKISWRIKTAKYWCYSCGSTTEFQLKSSLIDIFKFWFSVKFL